MKVSRVDEMREMDRTAIEKYGIPDEILMENAGHASYEVIRRKIGLENRRFLICCGAGNNGGDGLVVARKLFSNRATVQALLLGDPEKFKGSAKLNYDIVQKMGIPCARITLADQIIPYLSQSDVIIDAIFGTGLDREVGGKYREIIELINQSDKQIVSLDIPSGINGNTGQIMGTAVKAHFTVTFGLPKIGNLLYPGFEHNGRLFVTHISFPPEIYQKESVLVRINEPAPLPERPGDAHKGSCGKALFVAGAANYLGAPYFSAHSFLKAGGGLSYLATPQTIAPFIAERGPEIVLQPLSATEQGSISPANLDFLLKLSEEMEMVALGPGASLQEETQQLIRDLAAKLPKPVLIDGDGLTAIAQDLKCIKKRKAPTILTPHPGEMSRLTKYSLSEIQSNRIDILQETCKKLNSIIVLKGAHSLIGLPDGRVFINLSGNPGMATAGSGDVLTGTIVAMFAQFRDAIKAALTGVFVHGLAGDIAAGEKGEDGIVASDILNALPAAIAQYRKNRRVTKEEFYEKIEVI
ncbi:MAG: NAD(P)H-hydrate dehydratase [Calditrichaeota bacterium]|nr:NAD(P)H-hydrate dehydratase [Calditrichota bacterium]